MAERFYARSASDRTDDWPYWFVADSQKGGLNVTRSLVPSLAGYAPLLPKELAMNVARTANLGLLDG